MRLCIASVALSSMHPRVALGLSSNMFYLGKHKPDLECVEYLPERMAIASARNLAVKYALSAKCDYFFWLDDDTVLLDPHTIHRLLEVIVDRPKIRSISPTYYIRSYPYQCMAFRPTGPHTMILLEEGEEEEMADHDGIIMGLRAIGNGCTLLNMEIFKKMEASCASDEWFRTEKHFTEDAFFCSKAASVDPNWQCAVDTTVTAAHLLGVGWVHAANIRYCRLKYRLACALDQDPERYDTIEELLDEWKPKVSLEDMPLHLDSSLGRY